MHAKLSVVAFALLCLALGAVAISAQQPGDDGRKSDKAASSPGDPGAMGMGGKCAMMQKEMSKMKMGMHQAHEKMQGMMKEMNAATGPAKVDAMAAVMNEQMAHMDKMHDMHAGMMSKMMEHMSEHMMGGAAPKAKEEMMMCPMMKGHGAGGGEHGKGGEGGDHAAPPAEAPKAGGAEDHSAHHPPA